MRCRSLRAPSGVASLKENHPIGSSLDMAALRAPTGVASLKAVYVAPILRRQKSLRALAGAASLKHLNVFPSVHGDGDTPRPHGRGLVEASSSRWLPGS